MTITYLDAYTIGKNDIDLTIFEQFGNFVTYDRTLPDQIIERAKDATILLVNKVKLTEEILVQLPKLKYIGVTATGYNVIDLLAAKELGIVVTNAKNYSSMAVAQQTFAMILAFSNRLAEHADNNKWLNCPDFCYYDFTISELKDKTLGLIGFGDIAQKVAQIALAFEMKVLVNKQSVSDNLPLGVQQTNLDTVLSQSDYLSLHCPLTVANEGFICTDALLKMKPNAVIINTARGGLINEADLAQALNSNIINGAYLDVLINEPPSSSNPLLTAKNCKISPHIAWTSIEARQKLVKIVFDNIQNYLNNQPSNVVN